MKIKRFFAHAVLLAGFFAALSCQAEELMYNLVHDNTKTALRQSQISSVFGTPAKSQFAYVHSHKVAGRRIYRIMLTRLPDGNNVILHKSKYPILSPSLSPDNTRLTYVEFTPKGYSVIYIHNIKSNKRTSVSRRKGINGAPSWSADGARLAYAVRRNGNLDIYVLNIKTNQEQRITSHPGIDTEPTWSPDGKSIYFTSDRSGQPQIYQIPVSGGAAKLLTKKGKTNFAPSVSADGRSLVFVHQAKRKFSIAILNLRTSKIRRLSEGRLDESPSFSPDGKFVLYSSKRLNKSVLNIISLDGKKRISASVTSGDLVEPFWGNTAH